MRPVIVSTSASGTYAGAFGGIAIPLDLHRAPFNVGIAVYPTSGTPSITIQHTFSDPFSTTDTLYWANHSSLVSVSATTDGNYAFPVRGLRVLQTGAGNAQVVIVQAGLTD